MLMRRRWVVLWVLAVLVVAGSYLATAPQVRTALPDQVATVDLTNGETMFWAGGCASCHAAEDSDGEQKLLLGGGLELDTPFGVFAVPNISPDPEFGIGAWTDLDFVRAMQDGVSPSGKHYYPAFPYEYYQYMTVQDLLDLRGYLQTLPPVATPVAASKIAFPYNIRRGIGLWKHVYLSDAPWPQLTDPQLQRGQYLVRGPGHCGFCHTPRNQFGGLRQQRYLGGAPALEVGADGTPEGRIPNITSHKDGIGSWAAGDIAFALETGFDPDYDSFGGTMVAVQENMARLSADDRAAMAAYLKTVPPLAAEADGKP
ncbi:MAG: cytochrome c [Pseudomonadota bacterium]